MKEVSNSVAKTDVGVAKKAVVFNLGCKVNQYECDVMSAELASQGYKVSDKLVPADLFVVNTCAVTAEAERKSRQIIARIRAVSPNAEIKIVGCATKANPNYYKNVAVSAENFAVKSHNALHNRKKHYIKIQDGCNEFCSYCIVPHLRGRSVSRPIADIVAEAKEAESKYAEIVLVGINISAFGQEYGENLPSLVRALSGIKAKIGLGSFYVDAIKSELLDALAGLFDFNGHFHLSLQSGDSEVLKAMNRRYSAEDIEKSVALIRNYFPNAIITADVIVGYPTETDENFDNTFALLKKVALFDLHVFPFSARPKTEASKLKPLPSSVINERKSKLASLKNVK